MCTEHVNKNVHSTSAQVGSTWKSALQIAEEQLKSAKGRVLRLQAAIRTIRQRIDDGTPFPGQKEASSK